MKKLFLFFIILLSMSLIVTAVPVSYKGTITYDGEDINTSHSIESKSASRTTNKTINESNFVINHLVKKGEIVKFYFDNTLFTEYVQPLPGTIIDLGAWNIIPDGLPDLYKAKSDLTYTLILNGNPSKDDVIANLYLPTNLTAYPTVTISWTSTDESVIAINGTITRSETEDKTVILTATLTENDDITTSTFTVTVKQTVAAADPDENGKVEIGYDEPEVVLDNSNINETKNIEIPPTVSPNEIVSLNLGSLMTENNVTLGNKNLTLTRKINASVNYSAEIPMETVISGPSDWNGLLNFPTVKDNSEVTVDGTTELVIEIGYTGGQLNFSKAVKLTLTGMAGKKAGYTRDDTFYLMSSCTPAQITDPDTLLDASDCYTDSDNGIDLIIWTKHFTKFAAYIPTPPTPTAPTGGGGDPGVPAACVETWTCTDWSPATCTPVRRQTRTCTDANDCGTEINKPRETRTCLYYVVPEEEVPEEEVPEEVEEEVPEEEAPAEAVTPPAQRGLATRITGAVTRVVTKAATGKAGIGSLITITIIIIIAGLSLFSQFYGGMPHHDHFTRASNFHRRAEKAHRKGKHEKAEKLYKKGQILREKGEKIIFRGS